MVHLQAVIFDVDGVLVQSMEWHHKAYQAAVEPIGLSVRREEVFANEGRRSREIVESLLKSRGIAATSAQIDALDARKRETFLGFGPLPLYPGVPALLDRLTSAGLRIAAVTGTARRNVDQHLRPLLAKFETIVTADDVMRTKPDPEPYLAALRNLRLSATDAIVVENAPLGIRSAKAAGLRVIGVTSTQPASALEGADWIVPDVVRTWDVAAGLLGARHP